MKRLSKVTLENAYTFGFNGQERKDDYRGKGNSLEFRFRSYESRIGRFTSLDPLAKDYPWNSPYAFAENTPTAGIDLEGLEFYYTSGGKFLGRIGTSQQVYTADKIVARTREIADANGNKLLENYSEAINSNSLNITHDRFQKVSSVVMQEGNSNVSDEYLWIAHSNNNAALESKTNFTDNLLSFYSSVQNKGPLNDNDKSIRAESARAGVIDVLSGGADPTGGAELWDGADYLAWGLHSPNGTPQNKFEEYNSMNISSDIYNSYLSNTMKSYPNGYNYKFKGKNNHSNIPAGVFKDGKNWSAGGFNFKTGAKAPYSIEATGTRGGSIFWKIIRKKTE